MGRDLILALAIKYGDVDLRRWNHFSLAEKEKSLSDILSKFAPTVSYIDLKVSSFSTDKAMHDEVRKRCQQKDGRPVVKKARY